MATARVGEYFKKKGNPASNLIKKIYEVNYINKATKVSSLAGNPRKLLSLYATLSNTQTVIFDLAGVDPIGAENTCEIVKQIITNGGAAILLDHFNDKKDSSIKNIELEWIEKTHKQ